MNDFIFSALDENGKEYFFDSQRKGNSVFLTLKKENFQNAKKLFALGNFTKSEADEEGYYVFPTAINIDGDMKTNFIKREDASSIIRRPVMGWFGIKHKDFSAIIRAERSYNFSFWAEIKNGVYSAGVIYNFIETEKEDGKLEALCDMPAEDIKIEIVFLDKGADYCQMAAAERNLRLERGEITTLAQKCKREVVEYHRKHPLVRIRMGWKPSPSPIKHQTVENEPPMYTACTFERVREIADALKAAGVEGADLQLVGWNKMGHDGRFPQHLPVEEAFGGEKELKKTIEYVKSLGYKISLHTISIDAYTIANNFSWDYIVKRRNGEHHIGGDYGGGYAYHVCPKKQLEVVKKEMDELATYGLNGLHYNDVTSIVVPDACFSEEHPSSTGESVKAIDELMDYFQNTFGGFSSEGAFDFSLSKLDFALYVRFGAAFGDFTPSLCDEFIPLWELTYHGIILYNPRSSTVNYNIKAPEEKINLIMSGGKPTFYIYSKFRSESEVNWMGTTDLLAYNEQDLKITAEKIREGEDILEKLADKQLLFMERYDILDGGIKVVTYSDGSKIIGNSSASEQCYEGRRIAPYSYIII